MSTKHRQNMNFDQKGVRNNLTAAPAYVSYKTFAAVMDRLRQKGVPNQIDRSYLSFLSGTNQSQILSALRYLGLTSSKGSPTDRLDKLVKSIGPHYAISLRDVLKSSYSFLFNGFDLTRATLQEVEDKFSDAGASGDTLRKSISFFLNAARVAEVPTSLFITKVGRQRRSHLIPAERRRESFARERSNSNAEETNVGNGARSELLVSKFPQFDPAWPDEIKAKWFEAFQMLMTKLGN
jgi:hypothetical protein